MLAEARMELRGVYLTPCQEIGQERQARSMLKAVVRGMFALKKCTVLGIHGGKEAGCKIREC